MLGYLRTMSAFARVVWGLGFGIFIGLFFGESAGIFELVGTGYIRLLQMTVIPYVLVSLVGGLGRLNLDVAKRAGICAGALILMLWGVTLLSMLFLPLAYPDWVTSTFFSASLLQQAEPFDPLTLYVPSNPFYAHRRDGGAPGIDRTTCGGEGRSRGAGSAA